MVDADRARDHVAGRPAAASTRPLLMARRKPAGGVSVLRDAFQTQLWPLPIAGVAIAVVLGIGVPQLDALIDGGIPDGVSSYLFGGGPDAARTVLSSISGSLITVTSLTFSLTVVTLQLASGQFSPRLLRTFSRDRFVHVTLALFLATFTYSLIVLRTVRSGGGTEPDLVPQVSITLAVVAALASVVCLVLFLAHLARQIRVETILDTVHDEAKGTLRRMLDVRSDSSDAPMVAPPAPLTAIPLLVQESGFLVSVDEDDLVDAAIEAGAVISVEGFPGGSLVAGTPLGRCWPIGGGSLSTDTLARLTDRVGQAVHVGPERTAAQDIGFGLRQLTDVTDKALSPGINDPTTAVHALGHISGLLCEALDYELGPRILLDGGDIRVVLQRPDFGELLDSAIAQPRRFGADSPSVLLRIAQLLREAAWCAKDVTQRESIRGQAERLRATCTSGTLDDVEIEALTQAIDRVHLALAHDW